jgi:hypothetical protein
MAPLRRAQRDGKRDRAPALGRIERRMSLDK